MKRGVSFHGLFLCTRAPGGRMSEKADGCPDKHKKSFINSSFLFYGIIGKAVLQLKAICADKRNTGKWTGLKYEGWI